MKKIFILSAGFLAVKSHAQCTILGDSTIQLNVPAYFYVEDKAQCENCYNWKSSKEQNIQIEGKSNRIIANAKTPGQSILSVSLATDKGIVQCEKLVEVVDAKQNPKDNQCGIIINDFKDVKVTNNLISFLPNTNSSDYQYEWNVYYANGELKNSSEIKPQFPFSETNFITVVKLRITNKNPICTVTYTKKYDQSFWQPTKLSYEQRVYAPVSYSEYTKSSDNSKNKD